MIVLQQSAQSIMLPAILTRATCDWRTPDKPRWDNTEPLASSLSNILETFPPSLRLRCWPLSLADEGRHSRLDFSVPPKHLCIECGKPLNGNYKPNCFFFLLKFYTKQGSGKVYHKSWIRVGSSSLVSPLVVNCVQIYVLGSTLRCILLL